MASLAASLDFTSPQGSNKGNLHHHRVRFVKLASMAFEIVSQTRSTDVSGKQGDVFFSVLSMS
jgi:hypothetical protein